MAAHGVQHAAAATGEACRAIRQHLAQGAPWDACDAFQAAAAGAPTAAWADPELLYCGALAHARAGAPAAAHRLLDQAQAAGAGAQAALFEQVLSLRARLAKDRLTHCRSGERAVELARQAFDAYHAAYVVRGDPFPGINAASMAWLAGDAERARGIAGEVAARLAAQPLPHDAWHHASVGEAALLQGRADAARAAYRAAFRAAGDDIGSVARMRSQLRLLAATLPLADQLLEQVPAPAVLAFSGHMIDVAGRAVPRFPAALAPAVGEALRAHLGALHRPIVYASAACGADLLLAEAACALGAELTLVLPFEREDFVRTSVAVGGAQWVARFEQALQGAHRVIMATDDAHLGDDVLFEHAARLVDGLAVERAAQLSTQARLLAVLSGREADQLATGGTAAAVQRWRATGRDAVVIDLDTIASRSLAPASPRGEAARPAPPAGALAVVPAYHRGAVLSHHREAVLSHHRDAVGSAHPVAAPVHHPERSLKALLFADFAGFGHLRDAQAPQFHARFLDIIAARIAAAPVPPIQVNTWGDALYAVFDAAPQAADFAWQLLEGMRGVDWKAAGLGADGQIRIALHAGPVFRGWDPVIGRDNHFGSSVTQAARIEPVTQPGTIYASEAFAATLAAGPVHGFLLEYLGVRALAKDHGEMRLYRLQRPQQ